MGKGEQGLTEFTPSETIGEEVLSIAATKRINCFGNVSQSVEVLIEFLPNIFLKCHSFHNGLLVGIRFELSVTRRMSDVSVISGAMVISRLALGEWIPFDWTRLEDP